MFSSSIFRLSFCEKALAEYLETKRLAFPRFYFVSSADLLDILSKGAQPKQVNFLAIIFKALTAKKYHTTKRNKGMSKPGGFLNCILFCKCR